MMEAGSVFYWLNVAGATALPVLMAAVGWALLGNRGTGARMVVAGAAVYLLCWVIQFFAPFLRSPLALDAHQAHALWGAFFLIMVSANVVFLCGVLLHVLRSRSSGIRREVSTDQVAQQQAT